jgi:cytochrome c5
MRSGTKNADNGVVLSAKRCSLLLLIAGPAALYAAQLPDGPGKATTQKICSGCHAAEIVLGHRDTKAGWERVVSNMVDKGANGTDDEFNAIIDYLATYLPKKPDSSSDSQPKQQ